MDLKALAAVYNSLRWSKLCGAAARGLPECKGHQDLKKLQHMSLTRYEIMYCKLNHLNA
jgi:hypothetical protein